MSLATITTKGQVTIPKAVRESLKLAAGDKIQFVIMENGEALIRPLSKKVDDVFGKLHLTGRKTVSTEAMDAEIAKRLQEKTE